MLTRILSLGALLAILAGPAYAQDWGIDQYGTYDPGFYNDTTSDLYDDNDDWYYDNYTIADQELEEDVGLDYDYAWESDDDLFADDDVGL